MFNGNDHRILNFTWRSDDGTSIGLFGYVDAPCAAIRNLGLIAPKVELLLWSDNVGSLVGHLHQGVIAGCYVTDSDVRGNGAVGGLVGSAFYGTLIKDCDTRGIVTGNVSTGGLVGLSDGCLITNCRSMATVTGGYHTGGLVGLSQLHSVLVGCHSSGNVTGTGNVGGLVGRIGGSVTACSSNATVVGDESVGGLAGYNTSVVSYSHSAGTVVGGEDVGGLVGHNFGSRGGGTIIDSYSTASVTGDENVGGLAGWNSYVITHCYSAGTVDGEAGVGGLVGCDEGGYVSGAFWDVEASGVLASAAGEGKTTAETQTASTFLAADWDFVDEMDNGAEKIWAIEEGAGYPQLVWTGPFGGGTGHPGDPYLIYTAEHLNAIGANREHRDKHFALMADIDLSVYSETEFNIISGPTNADAFEGIFDGNGHAIYNFAMTTNKRDSVGLFGYVRGAAAEIRNVRLIDPNVNAEARDCIGALVGMLREGTIRNCCAQGAIVRGRNKTGGLVGQINNGTIANSFATGVVEGRAWVGGLAGGGLGAITNCYAKCDTVGIYFTGGLVGYNGASPLANCYASGPVNGYVDTGGLTGSNPGDVLDSFWDIEASGQTSGVAGTGLTSEEMQIASTYLEAGWDFAGETENGTEEIWWILEGQDYPRLWWERADAEF